MEPRIAEDQTAGSRTISWHDLVAVVFYQAWSLCIAYLAAGLAAELLRRSGLRSGDKVQAFLDGMPIFGLRVTGALDWYLGAVATGQLTPFWNRVLLSSMTVGAIMVQASVIGLFLMACWKAWRHWAR